MLLTEINFNEKGLEWYNSAMKNLRKDNPHKEEWKEETFNDLIVPYSQWLDAITDEDVEEYDLHLDTLKREELAGCYLSDPNVASHLFDQLTFHKFAKRRAVKSGICDNASQVINKHSKIVKDKNKKYIIFLSPVFKCDQQVGTGFRWSRYGKYIGVQDQSEKLLVDEPYIEFIFKYSIYEIKEED